MTDRQAIKAAVVALAEMYGEALSENRIKIYADVLGDYPIDHVKQAFRKIIRDPIVTRFPLPAAILKHLEPLDPTDDQVAVEVAARIVSAIAKFGWNNAQEAQGFIGSIGWTVVHKQGGWQTLCENLRADDIGIFQAQIREISKVQIRLARAGKLYQAPALPEGPPPPRDRLPQRLVALPLAEDGK